MKSLSARYPREWTASVSNSIQIYNLIPGVVYHYDVCNAAGTSLKSGFVRPEGQVRMINGFSYNVRDMGGWQAIGGTIAYGKLYRGAELDRRIDEAGKKIFFNDLGISIDLDLRRDKDDNSERHTDYLILGTNGYKNIQVLKFFDNGSGRTCELYQQAIREIIGWLSDRKAVYLHCVGGADRTGTLAFLIEALVGVSESDLSKDYELTNFDGSHDRKRNATSGSYIFTYLINYLRSGRFGDSSCSMNQLVENWAKTQFSNDPNLAPLTDEEIATLRSLLVVTE